MADFSKVNLSVDRTMQRLVKMEKEKRDFIIDEVLALITPENVRLGHTWLKRKILQLKSKESWVDSDKGDEQSSIKA